MYKKTYLTLQKGVKFSWPTKIKKDGILKVSEIQIRGT